MGYPEDGYIEGLERVVSRPQPEGQKFDCGSYVMIAEDLGPYMPHFPKGLPARINHTYRHAYGGQGADSYCLNVRYSNGKWSITSWYHEEQLTQIVDQKIIDSYNEELRS